MMIVETGLFISVLLLMVYALIRRRWQWFEVLVPTMFMLLIPFLIAVNHYTTNIPEQMNPYDNRPIQLLLRR